VINKSHRNRRSRARSASAIARSRNSGFLICSQSENHPGLAVADASQHFIDRFIDRSATPPCGDARRGMCPSNTFRHFFRTP
jgi:hypothetical protein